MAINSSSTIAIDINLNASEAIREADALGAEIKKLKDINQLLAKSNQQTSSSYVANSQAIQNLSRQQRAYTTIANQTGTSQNDLRAKLSLLTSQYNSLSRAERDNSDAGKQLTKDIVSIRTEIEKTEQKIGDFRRNIGNYQSALSGVGGSLKSIAAGYLSVAAAIRLVNEAFSVALKSDAINTTLAFTLKSTDEANLKLTDLRDTADRLGLNFLTLAQSYTKFSGAAIASNFSLTEADRIFNSVSGAAARFHLSSDQLEGALLALQQMISKGNVQAEELRGQLGERLPGAFSIAARAMGVTEKQLNDLLKSGSVLASDLLPKLATELDKTFSLDADTRIDSLTASTNRLSTAVDTALQSDGVGKLFRQFVDGSANAVSAIDKLLSSRSTKEFFARIIRFDASNYDAANAASDSFKTSVERSGSVKDPLSTNNETAKANVDKLTKAYGEAYHAYSLYFELIKKGGIANTEATQEQLETYKTNAQDIFEVLTIVNGKYQISIKNAAGQTKELTDAQLTSVEQIRKRITELSKLTGSAIVGSDLNKRINDLKARLKDLNDPKEDKARLAALQRINEDRIKSELETAQRLMTTREIEIQEINAGMDKRKKLYEKYGQDTTQLELERQTKIYVLNQKFHQQDLAIIRKNLNEAAQLRISLIGDASLRTFETQQLANQQQIDETDRSLGALAARIALGEQGLTTVIQSELEKRNALVQVGDQQRQTYAEEGEERLRQIRQNGYDDAYAADIAELERQQALNDQRIKTNQIVTQSYADLVGAVGDLTGKQTLLGKIAFVAQKVFAIQQIILNAELAKSEVVLRYEILKRQAVQAASLAGPFAPAVALAATIGLSIAEGAEIARVTASEVVQVAIVAATTIAGVAGKAKGGIQGYTSDGKGGVLKGYSKKDDTNAYLRSGEAVVVSEAARDPATRALLSDINVAYGGNPYPNTPGYALGGIYGGSGLQQVNSDITNQVYQTNQLNEAISKLNIFVAVTDINSAQGKQAKIVDAGTF